MGTLSPEDTPLVEHSSVITYVASDNQISQEPFGKLPSLCTGNFSEGELQFSKIIYEL